MTIQRRNIFLILQRNSVASSLLSIRVCFFLFYIFYELSRLSERETYVCARSLANP